MKYLFECADGHEPEMMTVEAGNDDEAMTQMMEKAKSHLSEKHGGNPMTDDQMRDFIMGRWRKEEGM